jgi:hypothetical protein
MNQARIDKYDVELHELLPKIVGLHAVVSSIKPHAYRRLKEFIDEIYEVDRLLGEATLEFEEGHPESAAALAALRSRARGLEDKLPLTVRAVIADVTKVSEAELLASP